ncbi:2-succinyl-5-enolpyruvyl-6-hydroxy-3-cyclohexene-1-carboxylate synthase [Aeromicrobium chenweiae]|uniref:2-succinyl-5-enolpyruvyl-6-hydroxy-3-cyclohexene-1-carboxylate synthase n=1 Tax=Aeromicrobium chenweiae TaxID=2079793 RepID=A0A2S0WQJ3_9ACTN|nr:thiamine pyrophosphate-binding protein [Aeromicrobium chenweiae]AWB93528.1 2-succinyl-5-enolpyruvyl-6-hydroxy-3-cyclohexene-1-carboxylate synthase [Aeromicrobium chenweiae]TGN33178.1 2-succinyl-5-enolpyruvyl-6-hydroxy-3-cyclohexene-1-carboxylate synthase [Aeromicrobium chenweiae]
MSEQHSVGVARRLAMHLLGLGVTDAVLAPGSRSGPLALALAAADEQGLIRLHVRVDEREAAFLALGMAKASRRLVPVVTTSGTAVANLHPAMLEAVHSDVPVLAITADRPGRLRGTGANQTTDQREIFPGVPFVERVKQVTGGPAHLNLELDEPLIEPVQDWDFGAAGTRLRGSAAADPHVLDPGPRTVVVAGDDARQPARIAALDGGWPLLAEPSSGSRNGDEAIVAYRLLLAHAPLADRVERVVSFGHATLSRPVSRLLARTDIEIVHVGDQSTFPVPAGENVTFTHEVQVAGPGPRDWLGEWKDADRAATAAIDGQLDGSTPYDVAKAVNAAVPPGGLLFVGSSSPIRDLDLVARPYPVGEKRLVIANRGLAGIDGTLSTAIGAALARPSTRAIAYVGDLTFLHGSNGLLIGPEEPRPDLTIVVASDDGGSIFSTLEQGGPEYAASFERIYATPTGADIGALCAGYRVPHRLVRPADLADALAEDGDGIRVLEVPVDREGRRDLGDRIAQAVRAALKP